MFEKNSTPPNNSDVTSKAIDLLMNAILETETDPRRRTQLLIMQKCKKLIGKFGDIAKEYSQFSNEEITETDAKSMLEYLLLVESGVDNYLASEKSVNDE